jgi:hypothetical protein
VIGATPGTFPDSLASYSITSPNTIGLHLTTPPPSLLAEANLRGLGISGYARLLFSSATVVSQSVHVYVLAAFRSAHVGHVAL